MTPADLKSIRQQLGLSGEAFARMLGYDGTHMRAVMYALENGIKPIREPQRRLAIAYRDGYRPDDWPSP